MCYYVHTYFEKHFNKKVNDDHQIHKYDHILWTKRIPHIRTYIS